ncbi:hypothetical protein CEXT_773861 [Caerostris extrusa]|uniref:Uncharacterized protein n=1 Tax=Caerostris extrusa TaxID=172846 RepID=A0AAV4X524_CAEEX|nr:hypothetical protein CEXT_773861 [Caerostris extrusa]
MADKRYLSKLFARDIFSSSRVIQITRPQAVPLPPDGQLASALAFGTTGFSVEDALEVLRILSPPSSWHEPGSVQESEDSGKEGHPSHNALACHQQANRGWTQRPRNLGLSPALPHGHGIVHLHAATDVPDGDERRRIEPHPVLHRGWIGRRYQQLDSTQKGHLQDLEDRFRRRLAERNRKTSQSGCSEVRRAHSSLIGSRTWRVVFVSGHFERQR